MHDDDAIPSNREALPRSRAAERMRRHRDRKRSGLRCFTVQLWVTEIDELVRRGLLNQEKRNERGAIVKALHGHFDCTLNPS